MNFSKALETLIEKKKVTRKGWNGKGMWLELYENFANTPIKDDKIMQPFICMKTAQNTYVPWVASQTDMLAGDWEIVE